MEGRLWFFSALYESLSKIISSNLSSFVKWGFFFLFFWDTNAHNDNNQRYNRVTEEKLSVFFYIFYVKNQVNASKYQLLPILIKERKNRVFFAQKYLNLYWQLCIYSLQWTHRVYLWETLSLQFFLRGSFLFEKNKSFIDDETG